MRHFLNEQYVDIHVYATYSISRFFSFLGSFDKNKMVSTFRHMAAYGIICFGMGLTLREGSREYFFRQLDHLFPGMKEKYLQTYGMQYQIVSNKNDELMQLFHHTCEKNGIVHDNRKTFEYLSTFETKCDNVQLSLFDKDFAGKSPNGI